MTMKKITLFAIDQDTVEMPAIKGFYPSNGQPVIIHPEDCESKYGCCTCKLEQYPEWTTYITPVQPDFLYEGDSEPARWFDWVR